VPKDSVRSEANIRLPLMRTGAANGNIPSASSLRHSSKKRKVSFADAWMAETYLPERDREMDIC
jgi:hypothetical protein